MEDEYIGKYLKLYKKTKLELKIKVLGDSMMPILHDGDYVNVKNSASYNVGDIIVYENEKMVVHRVIDVQEKDNQKFFITKGDNNFIIDPLVCEDLIVGKVIAIFHNDFKYKFNNNWIQKLMTKLSKEKVTFLGRTEAHKYFNKINFVKQLQIRATKLFYINNRILKLPKGCWTDQND